MQRPWRSFAIPLLSSGLILIGTTCAVTDSLSPPVPGGIHLSIEAETTLVLGARVQPAIHATSNGAELAAVNVRWSSSDTNIVAIRGDTLVGKALGRVTIEARITGAMVPIPAPVTTHSIAVVPRMLIVEPSQILLYSLGETETLVAFATDFANQPIPGLTVRWESSDPARVTVNAFGIVTAREQTTAPVTITARVEGLSAEVPATVTQRLANLVITPAVVALSSIGETGQLSVAGRDVRGNSIAPSAVPVVGWQSLTPGIVSITSGGIVTALDNGVAMVRAIVSTPDGLVADTAQVAVEQVATSVIVTAVAGTTINAVTDAIPLVARGFDARDVEVRGKRASWSSRDGAIASPDQDGRVTGFAVGSAWVVARIDAAFDSVRVTVQNDPQTIALQPNAFELLAVGDSVLLTASARNAVGVIIPDATLTWQSSDAATVTIVGTGNVRYAKAIATGSATITVNGGVAAATSYIQVTNHPTVVAIVPDTIRLTYLTETATPPVDFRNALGVSLPVTSVTWSSDDNAIAQVAPNGVITARAVGTTRIHASSVHATDAAIVVVTNQPVSLVLPVARDTITAIGQTLTYAPVIRNAIGALITDASIVWTSTNESVASIAGNGVATVSGVNFGTALVIATAGAVADTITVVVTNPTRVYVDNSPFTGIRNGTSGRPYFRIQEAVDAADPSDTVYVRKGVRAYSETVALSRRLTLLGAPTSFNANNPDITRLPVIAHDTGSAAIIATTTSPQVIRLIAIRHTAEGPAIDARGPELTLEHVYINPAEVTRIGAGITVDNGSTGARVTITKTTVNAVRGYGIRLVNVNNPVLSQVTITGVDSTPSSLGAGLEISGGANSIVSQITTRAIGGSHLHYRHTTGFALTDFALSGRDQLIRIDSAGGGSSFVTSGRLDLTWQPGDVITLMSQSSDVAGIHLTGATGVTFSSIDIIEGTTASPLSLMDAMHFHESYPLGSYNTVNDLNVTGTRVGLQLTNAKVSLANSRVMSGELAIQTLGRDTLAMLADTLGGAAGCMQIIGDNARASLDGVIFDGCRQASQSYLSFGIWSSASNSELSVIRSRFTGADMVPLYWQDATGSALSITESVFLGGAPTVDLSSVSGAITLSGGASATVRKSVIGGYRSAALNLDVGALGTTVLDSNMIVSNGVGVRVTAAGSIAAANNDWYGNDTAAVVVGSLSGSANLAGNFWGDQRGPRRSFDSTATGDSLVYAGLTPSVRTTPLYAGSGAAAGLRAVRGQRVHAPDTANATVRVVDANGLPLAGVAVTFACASSDNCGRGNVLAFDPSLITSPGFTTSGTTPGVRTVTSRADGLAEIRVVLPGPARSLVVTATVASKFATPVTVTSTP